MAKIKKLKDCTRIIEVLGGTAEVSRLTRRQMAQVARWKRWNSFPPQTYLIMTQALAARGYVALPGLWSQEIYDPEAPKRRRWVLRLEETQPEKETT
jgi:hypothetical protein